MCVSKSSIMGKYLNKPNGTLKEKTESFSLDANHYRFIITKTTEEETDIGEYHGLLPPRMCYVAKFKAIAEHYELR